ncbi:lipoprotein signal peptidase [Spongiibacter sp. KMU-158]|uniref:Lipoprotein signal peptidase n=1 Tax=Spongiibacter pelagi TaxID=2760804 RepID=A0A927C211_9GAMM|nr:signal peptidase II [Spongiibacter pelagi]MBD2858713.1 lipoprotein signal peptidase [Spongiibacter pelagi]
MPKHRTVWLLVLLAAVALDQYTKQLAESLLNYAQPVEWLSVLDMTLHYNRGAAFSFLNDAGGWQRWFFTALAFAVSGYLLVWLMKLHREQWLLSLALSLVAGGAIGNVIDRIRFGHVVDFISVHWGNSYFPTFNIADAAITVGAACMILDMLINPQQHK